MIINCRNCEPGVYTIRICRECCDPYCLTCACKRFENHDKFRCFSCFILGRKTWKDGSEDEVEGGEEVK